LLSSRATVSNDLPAPRFEAGARASGQLAERRIRLLVLAGGALLLALVASSVANAGRVSLRCVDGQLVAYHGSLLPVGEEPLDDPTLPPVPVPAAACEDEELSGLAELRARHLELTRGRVDEAIRSDDRVAIESTVEALDAMADPAAGGDGREAVLRNRRDLLGTIVDAKVEDARAAHQDALRWIERARQAGVDPARLRAAERALGLPESTTTEPEAPPAELAEAMPGPVPHEPIPVEPRTPRSL
jgi:hypothetical protein